MNSKIKSKIRYAKKNKNRILLVITILLILSMGLFLTGLKMSTQEDMISFQRSSLLIKGQQLIQKDNLIVDLNELNTIQNYRIVDLTETKLILETSIIQKDSVINAQQINIASLTNDLGVAQFNLESTQQDLEYAAQFQKRIDQGTNIGMAYQLLTDNDTTRQLIINENITSIKSNPSDLEIWSTAKDIYSWIGSNFDYCGDKTITVGDRTVQFQFWSPDELLTHSTTAEELNYPCGDCDDKADLFAGMMYAAGIPEEKVFVAIGEIPGGGHAWNWVVLDSGSYRVDPTCSSPAHVVNLFWTSYVENTYFPDTPNSFGCFSNYEPHYYYGPNGYNQI